MFNKKQIIAFKDQLISRQQQLQDIARTGENATKTVELDQSCTGRLTRMDAMQAQEMSIEAQRRRVLELQLIEAALQRLTQDKYGYCPDCGEAIAIKRLQHNPAVVLCINCASRMEQKQ
ncbi:MAG TPA: TraR/DksA family transcriptional regulator [Gammaproteobacteria bacterium]|nr:TraR/DksA family transcriptional regulator [Gammaproteobacteria bacterium]